MRSDMHKVIVERPRKWAGKLRNREPLDENERTKISAKRDARERGGAKTLNENLRPLERFFESRVGKPWDKVWSEVCAGLKLTSAVQKHVRDHVHDLVAVRTWLLDGEVWTRQRSSKDAPVAGSTVRLYVDPRSGLLVRNKSALSYGARRREVREEESAERAKRMRALSPKQQLHLLGDGAWWEVTLARVPTTILEQPMRGKRIARCPVELPLRDVVLSAGLSSLERWQLYDAPGVYASAKRRLSKKELRDFGLR
jgi:hypothetical protein